LPDRATDDIDVNADDAADAVSAAEAMTTGDGLRERPPLPEVDVWLVDGFNALHAVVLGGEDRERFWDRAHRDRLIERLGRGLAARTPIVLVFDGHRPVEGDEAHPAPGLEVVFAPSADDWIVKRARAVQAEESADEGARERVGVVSNDRKVVGRCRHAGACIVAPAAFMGHLAAAEEAGSGPRT